jgi:hypothetical protein
MTMPLRQWRLSHDPYVDSVRTAGGVEGRNRSLYIGDGGDFGNQHGVGWIARRADNGDIVGTPGCRERIDPHHQLPVSVAALPQRRGDLLPRDLLGVGGHRVLHVENQTVSG